MNMNFDMAVLLLWLQKSAALISFGFMGGVYFAFFFFCYAVFE